jgi:hypothetical protein
VFYHSVVRDRTVVRDLRGVFIEESNGEIWKREDGLHGLAHVSNYLIARVHPSRAAKLKEIWSERGLLKPDVKTGGLSPHVLL